MKHEVKPFTPEYYKKLGSDLEHGFGTEWQQQFYKSFRNHGDVILATLAQYAFWLCNARCERLAGRIAAAMLAEAEAESQYRKLPEDCRW